MSWSVHAGIELEKKGIPTATICTDEFVSLGQTEAESLGLPSLPLAVISHPLGGLKPDEVKKKAEGVLEEVIYILTRSREKLGKVYGQSIGQ